MNVILKLETGEGILGRMNELEIAFVNPCCIKRLECQLKSSMILGKGNEFESLLHKMGDSNVCTCGL